MARRRSLRFRLVASAIVLVASLCLLEGLARLSGPLGPVWQSHDPPGVIMAGHPTRLWGMAVGTGRNGDAKATVNTLGLRGPLPAVPRPEGRERILVLGDSTFFGHGVGDDDTIPRNLERALVAQGLDVDVVNGAIPGYSTEQTRIELDELGWDLQPTLLLVGNLWSDNNADGFRDADLLATRRFYAESPWAGSALFVLTASWLGRLRGGDQGHLVTWTRDSGWPEGNARRVPLQAYARNLDRMARDAASRGIGVAFIAPVNKAIVGEQPTPDAGWQPYFDAQRAVAAWHGVPLVESRAALRADPATTDEKFVDLMHPSASGAADIGREAAARLVAAGWPTERLLARAERFDASGLVDVPAKSSSVQAARYSPQAHLFPATFDPKAPAEAPDPNVVAPGSTAWEARGAVRGGTPPVRVRVVDARGETLAATTADAGGAFALAVPGDIGVAELIAEDAAGARTSAEAAKTAGPVSLTIP